MGIEVCLPSMDLKQIARSGQCFRMEEQEDGAFRIIAGERCVKIVQLKAEREECRFAFNCAEEEFHEFWREYFDLGRDYGAIYKRIAPEDAYLCRAAEFGWGIHILKQDLWEMIITFIISHQNNIPRIRRCVRLLCEKYGMKKKTAEGEEYFSFHRAEVLAGAKLEDLLACNLGYRGKYILKTAQMIAGGEFELQALCALPYEEAKKELMKLYGVGTKVAECVCLFALHHVDAFPIDTHMMQILKRQYPEGFPFSRYQGIAGILQQYMFYYELHGDKGWLSESGG